MGKVVFWFIVVFAVLFGLRMYNLGQQKKRERRDAPPPDGRNPGEAMVRCAHCGIFLPRSEASLVAGEIRCRDKDCR